MCLAGNLFRDGHPGGSAWPGDRGRVFAADPGLQNSEVMCTKRYSSFLKL